jgi:NTP pyrophosphatase (non-canonical NTP hydrolase)
MIELNFNAYQAAAKKTTIYPDDAKVVYPAMGLAGEAGEVCNKIKKITRGDVKLDEIKDDLAGEIGDVLWYVSALCSDMDLSLGDVARLNLDKLNGRLEKNLLGGTKMRSKLNDQTVQIESLEAEVKRLKDKLAFSLCLP